MSLIHRRFFGICLLGGVLLFAGDAVAKRVETTVSYVGGEFLYIQAGRSSGVEVGDSVTVERGGITLVHLIVLRTSEGFSACSPPEAGGAVVQVGDRALVLTTDEEPGETAQTETPANVYEHRSGVGRLLVPSEESADIRYRGRVTLGYRTSDDLRPAGRDIREPWGYFSFTMSGLPSEYHTLLVRARVRRIERDGWNGAAAEQNWNNRVYQVSFGYENPESAVNYQAGRLLLREVTGLGVMDGALASYRINETIRAGLFSGFVPDPVTSEFSSAETQSGAFVAGKGVLLRNRVDGTLAWIGRYRSGEINRESLYEQLRFDLGQVSGIYQSAELEINRGWRRDVVGESATLSNLLLQIRTEPLHNLRCELGYDSRRQVQDWRTRDLPDTLFDDALRQGWRGSVRWRSPWSVTLNAGGGLRTREGESMSARSLFAGLSAPRLPGRIGGAATLRWLANRYTEATLVSGALTRPLGRRLFLRVRAGTSHYRMKIDSSTVAYRWLGGTLDVELGRGVYSSLDVELASGDQLDTRRVALELGYRFK